MRDGLVPFVNTHTLDVRPPEPTGPDPSREGTLGTPKTPTAAPQPINSTQHNHLAPHRRGGSVFHIRGPPSAPAGRLEPPRWAAAALAHTARPDGQRAPTHHRHPHAVSPGLSRGAPRAILRKGSLLQSSGGRQRRVAPVARAAPSAMAWRSAKVRRAAREAAAALATAAAGAPCPASRSVAARRGSFLTLSARFFSLAYEGREHER